MKTSNRIFNLPGVIMIIFAPAYVHAQSLVISKGANLVMNEDAKIILQDASLVNHGSIHAGKSTFLFTGSNTSYIGGNAATNFHHVVLRQPGSQLNLDNDIAVSGRLEMQGGNLELNNRRINLGSSGSIEGENIQSRITGSNGGTITAVAILNAPQHANPGNLGIVISSAASLGTTIITRGHIQQVNETGEKSINRYYDLQPSTNVHAGITLRLLYLEPELSNHQEADLVLWSKTNMDWSASGKENSEAGNNAITKSNVHSMGRFTLGVGAAKTSMQAYPNPVRDRFTLVLYSDIETTRNIVLQDEQGRIIEKRQVNVRAGINNIGWNMGNRAAGTYNMIIENSKLPGVKVVKQ